MRLLTLAIMVLSSSLASAETLVYFGTYTNRKNESTEGIYVSKLDESSGYLSDPKLAAKVENPSFVAIHPNGKFLYAASEVFDGGRQNRGVQAFSIEDDGTLTKLNERSSNGLGACHVTVDPTGQCVIVSNYGGGSCASFPTGDDGSLGEAGSFHQHEGSSVNEKRQKGPHAHSANINAAGMQAFVCDLGLDKVLMYDLDAKAGKLTPSKQPFVETPPGGGPRHFSLHPSERFAYACLEMTSQVSQLIYDAANKTMTLGQTVSSVPPGYTDPGNSTAECLVHPTGKFLYVSNRGHNSIAVFTIDDETGELTRVENESTQGEVPRGFGIAPSGKFLIAGNQNSANVVSFRIDQETGELSPTGHGLTLGSAVNVRFLKR